MAAHGEVEPMPAAAIFADTQAEPASVYKWLDWLEKQLPFPVHRVTKGSLEFTAAHVRISRDGNSYTKSAIPAFLTDGEKTGLLKRQCTGDFKIEIIQREIRRLRENKETISQWIGISTDEAHRMKPALLPYIENRWPLIEAGVSRDDCLRWMRDHSYPEPPRSSCVFCPFHSNAEWQRLKDSEPAEFDRAVAFERKFQDAIKQTRIRGRVFLHRSLVPLDEIDFTAKAGERQPNLFGNECEGVCGV